MNEEPYNPSPIGNPSVLARRNWWQTKLVIFIGKHTPKCKEMVRILSQSMDEPMPLSMRIKKRIHYLICCWCQRYEEQLHYLRRTARAFPEHADESSTVPVPGETKARWKEALRTEPPLAESTVPERDQMIGRKQPSARASTIRRGNWNVFALAAAAAMLLVVFLFGWAKSTRPGATLADYRDEMVSFVKVEPNLEMRSSQLPAVMDWLAKSRAPARFAIPENVRNMELAGCRVLRFHGHDVTLVCFHRDNGRLLHLFVMDRAALPRLPARERAQFSQQGEWMTAAWAEGDHAYLMTVQGDQTLLERLLTDA